CRAAARRLRGGGRRRGRVRERDDRRGVAEAGDLGRGARPRRRHDAERAVSLAPLADLRVLSIEQFGAGPWATLQLADLGAEVIKLEDPSVGGDVGRYVPPYQEDESSLYFETFNRNKRSVSLDLRHPASRPVLEDLVRECDAVFSNLRGDQPAKLRLRYRDLAHVKRMIVCCSLSGFGTTGPRAREGAYDWTVQGLAGWQSVTGEPDGPPTKSGLSLADYCGGYVAAVALLGAVWRARRDGVGGDVDLSLFEAALAQLAYFGTWAASRGYEPVRRANSAHQSIVPFQNFEAADGWLVVACPKQALWERLCEAIDRTDLLADERYATFAGRDEHRDELLAELAGVFRTRSAAAWVDLLAASGLPCAPRFAASTRSRCCASCAATTTRASPTSTPRACSAGSRSRCRREPLPRGLRRRRRVPQPARPHRHRDRQHLVHLPDDEHEPDALQPAVRRADGVRRAARRLDAHARDRARALGRGHERE